MGVAVRRYYESPRHDDEFMEAWLELWDGERLLPGYGWVFGVGDGTSNVGLGLLNTSKAFKNVDYRGLLKSWLGALPPEWGYEEQNATGPVRGAALPMGFNRTPHYTRGLLLVGDSGGMINPFNGEGIDYALESGELAAQAALATLESGDRARLLAYRAEVEQRFGSYFAVGRLFVRLIGDPRFMKVATRYGLPRPTLMKLVLKLLANLYEPARGDAIDRVVRGLVLLAPSR